MWSFLTYSCNDSVQEEVECAVMIRINICCSAAQLCPSLCNPVDCSMPDLPVPHHLPKFCQSSCPLHQGYHLAISSFDVPPLLLPSAGTFPMSQLFSFDDQNTGASASVPVLPMNIQGWFPLRLTGLISLLSRELSGVFSSTTVQKHSFFGVLPSVQSSSHSLLGRHSLDYTDLCLQSNVSDFQHTV